MNDPNWNINQTKVPEEIDSESASSNYNNGIIEITFKKKEQEKNQTSRQINI